MLSTVPMPKRGARTDFLSSVQYEGATATLVNMSSPVEVLHDGRWLPATLLDARLDPDGWHGLVGYSDPVTRQGYYHWCRAVRRRRLRCPVSSLRGVYRRDLAS